MQRLPSTARIRTVGHGVFPAGLFSSFLAPAGKMRGRSSLALLVALQAGGALAFRPCAGNMRHARATSVRWCRELALSARRRKPGWMGQGSVSVGEQPLQEGLKERRLEVGGKSYRVVELEKTTDLVDDWIQNQMARVDPFGVVLWPAAQCIVSHLLHTAPSPLQGGSESGTTDATWLKGLRVVELGAGTGLCSIAAAAAGARVLTTDTNELTLDLVELAASRQHLGLETRLFDITG